jgi:hypothetical protein
MRVEPIPPAVSEVTRTNRVDNNSLTSSDFQLLVEGELPIITLESVEKSAISKHEESPKHPKTIRERHRKHESPSDPGDDEELIGNEDDGVPDRDLDVRL